MANPTMTATGTRDVPPSPRTAPDPAASRPVPDDRSIGDLIKELGGESSRLVREEVRLAKAEMREKVDVYERNLTKLAVGGALLLGALFVLLVAINRALTALLGQWVAVDVAIWLAPLILAALFALVGAGMVSGARRTMKREGITPKRTVETLREERNWAQQQAREVRHG